MRPAKPRDWAGAIYRTTLQAAGEYVGLGGTPSKPMPSNLFLNIILGISALAVLCKLGGIL